MTVHSWSGAVAHLIAQYDMEDRIAERVVEIAQEFGTKGQAVSNGIVTVNRKPPDSFEIIPPLAQTRLTSTRIREYTSKQYTSAGSKEKKKVAPRASTKARTTRAAAADTASSNGDGEGRDFTVYAQKDATQTMLDFGDWVLDEVFGGKYPGDEDAFRDGIRLGGTLRMEYQRSDHNKERREARKAERGAATATAKASKAKAGSTTSTSAVEKPASTRRAAGAKPGGRGAGRPAARAADRPATRRGAKAAAAASGSGGDEAPY